MVLLRRPVRSVSNRNIDKFKICYKILFHLFLSPVDVEFEQAREDFQKLDLQFTQIYKDIQRLDDTFKSMSEPLLPLSILLNQLYEQDELRAPQGEKFRNVCMVGCKPSALLPSNLYQSIPTFV
jgi:hypothetical protein